VKIGILRSPGVWDIDGFVGDVATATEEGFSSYWVPNLASPSTI
jgi:hypothetical protein